MDYKPSKNNLLGDSIAFSRSSHQTHTPARDSRSEKINPKHRVYNSYASGANYNFKPSYTWFKGDIKGNSISQNLKHSNLHSGYQSKPHMISDDYLSRMRP